LPGGGGFTACSGGAGAAPGPAGGGDGGHNGLRSLIGTLGTEDFIRVRLGVATAGGMPAAGEWVEHVLGAFETEERETVRRTARLAIEAVERVIDKGVSAAMNHFNRRTPDQ